MADNGKRVGSPTPSTRVSAVGSTGTGTRRHRATSNARSVLSARSSHLSHTVQPTGSRKINTSPPWARHEPPSPDGETPSNPIHTFLGTSNLANPNESQQYLSALPNTHQGRDASSSTTSSYRGRPVNSDVASMTSSAPDQLSEQQQAQVGWWPFTIPALPIPLRKNSGQPGPGSSLTSPFQSLFSQPQWMPVKGQEEKGDATDNLTAQGSAGGGVATGDEEDNAKLRSATRDRPRVQWLFDRAQVRRQGWLAEHEIGQQRLSNRDENEANQRPDKGGGQEQEGELTEDENGNRMRRRLRGNIHINIPRPNRTTFTVSNSRTPGWEQPWEPVAPPKARIRGEKGTEAPPNGTDLGSPFREEGEEGEEDLSLSLRQTKRQKRTQTFRTWLLQNNSVPLIVRLLNVTFTTATLAVAITIRQIERKNDVLGAVGSSPLLAIIFAPLTLVHVIISIYLEYFGKPLGLWRTSSKLLHTLLEMLFICMWSASLSLTFDNFFTSRLGCAPAWTTYWWNSLPVPPPLTGQGRNEGGPADAICDRQLVLIILVFFGLTLYCGSLVISLFRIFEKVKSHGSDMQLGRAFGMNGFGSLGSRLGRV